MVGQLVGEGLASGLQFLGATLLMIAAWMAGLSLAFGVSWLTVMDRIGAVGVGLASPGCASGSPRKREVAEGRERKQARMEVVKPEQKKSATRAPPRIEPAPPVVEKSERVEKERQVPLFEPAKAGELPPLKLLDDPPPQRAELFRRKRSKHCRGSSR